MDTDRHSVDAQSMARPAGDGQRIVAYAAIAALLALLLYPVARWLVTSWLVNPYYSHGFLIPPMAAFFAWRQWPRVAREPRRGETWPGLALAVPGLAAVVWATRWQNHVVAALAVVPLLAGIFLFLEGRARLRPWLFPLLFAALMVPLPIVDRLAPWMEAFTAHGAATVAHLLGLQVVNREGVNLGEVKDLLSTGPQTVIVLEYPRTDTDKPGQVGERMIPFVSAYVDRVDLPSRRILVDWQPDY